MGPNPLWSWAPSIQHPANLSPLAWARIHLSLILIYAYISKRLEAEAKDTLFFTPTPSSPSLTSYNFFFQEGEVKRT